jgi:uncharacterized protein (TIGR03000 family)
MWTRILGTGVMAVLTAVGVLTTPAAAQAQRGVAARPGVGVGARPGVGGYGPVLGGYGSPYVGSYYSSAYAGYRYPGYGYGYTYGGGYGLGAYRYGFPLFLGLGSTVGVNPYNDYPPDGYQRNYPPQNDPDLATPDPRGVAVTVQVRVPAARAEVWFSGSKTAQTGTVREFVSPPLTPGDAYTYEIRARWVGPDGLIDQTRQVSVRPGQRLVVDFSVAQ